MRKPTLKNGFLVLLREGALTHLGGQLEIEKLLQNLFKEGLSDRQYVKSATGILGRIRIDGIEEVFGHLPPSIAEKDFIDKLPQGINTIVGERGQMLSGGERQRITIARTLMRKPKIIIFDEATSSVDNITEQYIQRALLSIGQGRTSIIIAHRLSTIRHCDKLYVLKHGSIVEEGDHDTLIGKENSYYSKLWRIQTGQYIEMSNE